MTAEARRTTILQPVEQKPHSQKDRQNEKTEDYVPEKEQDKTPEKQLNEVEIGNLPEKEFRIMIEKVNKKFYNSFGNTKDPKYPKLEKENGAGGIRLPDFRLYYKIYIYYTTVIKTIWYWQKKQKYRSMEQDRKPRDKPTHLWSTNL